MDVHPSERASQVCASFQSRFGLNATNFLQAEAVAVVLPILNVFLRNAGWRFDSIGIATGALGLGSLVFQTPAGLLVDRFKARRLLFAISSVLVGALFAAVPVVPRQPHWIDPLLFLAGAAQTLFVPLLGALALALAGYRTVNRMLGENQSWNHAGNIAAAALAFFAVRSFGNATIFYSVALASVLAAGSVFVVRRSELNENEASTDGKGDAVGWRMLLRDPAILGLLVAVALFHLANAPILPMTALYIQKVGGATALTVLTVFSAQLVMIPIAWITGRLCNSWGRKPTLGLAFWFLPIRIAAYTLAHNPYQVIALQALDGIGAGIFGVAITVFAADLTRGKGRFNALQGIFATAQAIGGVAGPVVSGGLLQRFGFVMTFLAFAAAALVVAVVFQFAVPETRTSES